MDGLSTTSRGRESVDHVAPDRLLRSKKAIAAFMGIDRSRLDTLINRDVEPFVLLTDIGGVYVTEGYARSFMESQKRTLAQARAAGLFVRPKKAS